MNYFQAQNILDEVREGAIYSEATIRYALELTGDLEPLTSQLEHLIKLAKSAGWKEYAWHRAKELDAHPSRIWQGIAENLIKEMKNAGGKN